MLRFCSMVLLSLACGLGLSSGEVTAPAQPQTEESAGFLFEGREYIVEGGQERGPWLYESERITVLINRVSWRGRQCYVADVRLRDGERFFSGFAHKTPPGRKAEMPYRIARRYEAVLGLTADFLNHHSNPKGVMIRDGEVYFDGASADMLAVFDDGSMDVFRAGSVDAGGLLGMGARDVFAFGPILIEDGEINPKIDSHPLRPGNYRTGIGLVEQGHLIAVVTADGLTFREFARLFQDYRCDWAYNLDGGHSASMVFMGEQLNTHGYLAELGVYQRPLPDLIMAGHSKMVPGPDDPARYRANR